jgi:predicted nucleic acid-binding protein
LELFCIPLFQCHSFTDDIQLFEVTQRILRSAAQLRSVTNLKTPDAIHAATALDAGCTIFLTNDGRLRAVPGLSIVVLKDVLNA